MAAYDHVVDAYAAGHRLSSGRPQDLRLRRLEAPGYLARFTSLATRPTLPVTKPRC